jgi:hypothetical protein
LELTVRTARRSLTVPVLAAAITAMIAAGAAACSSSGSTDPLAGLTSAQIATKAVAATEAAPVVSVSGSGSDSGQTITVDLTLVHGKGCEGTLGEGNLGSLKLIDDGPTTWILPDSKFYKTSGAPSSVAALLAGKYLETASSNSDVSSLSQLCSMSKLLSQFTVDAGNGKGTLTTVDGQSAVEINDKSGAGHAWVSDTATPELLRIQKPGSSGGELNFTYPATAPALTAPPASETVDGSKYGF